MRRNSIGAALVVLLIFAPSAFAEPITLAKWNTPWLIRLPEPFRSPGGDVSLQRAFGRTAKKNGEFRDRGFGGERLPGTQAWAKVYGHPDDDCVVICADIFGDISIVFQRPLNLVSSIPRSWEVELTSNLVGFLSGVHVVQADDRPLAVVFAGASITESKVGATPLLEFTTGHQHRLTQNGRLPVLDKVVKSGRLRRGNYVVRGYLEIGTTVHEQAPDIFGPGILGQGLIADFFDGPNAGFRVGVTAKPLPVRVPQPVGVPEPASFVLLGTGVAALGSARWCRRRRDRTRI